jgi:hypothetical protein
LHMQHTLQPIAVRFGEEGMIPRFDGCHG